MLTAALLIAGLAVAQPPEDGLRQPSPTGRWWVFFTPETYSPEELDRRLDSLARRLSQRSLDRRAKSIPRRPPVRIGDLPPSPQRLAQLTDTGCRVLWAAPYLNAAVVTGSSAELARAERLPVVESLRPVMSLPSLNRPAADAGAVPNPRVSAEDYGEAFRQSALVNLPAAHAAGYAGRGVLIGVQDTGFDNLAHNCFRRLRVLAAWDFINGDPNVENEEGQMGNGSHGTRTLSVIAGLDSGRFIGAAPLAEFVLTKTENSDWERPVEEDWWVAGLWFHDSAGTEVLSSSLSYRAWYGWPAMNGDSAVTTRAADSAAQAGMVIVNSMGNTGLAQHPGNKMGAPADGRFVLSVGGVRSDSSHWSSASIGPTYDGRIKPDLTAQAVSVWTAANYSLDGYLPHNGTSFSCPMVAGLAALVIEANPRLSAAQVREILRSTAHRAQAPDTLDGWGIPDALAAVTLARRLNVNPAPAPIPNWLSLDAHPNPFNAGLHIVWRAPDAAVLRMTDLSGRGVWSRGDLPPNGTLTLPVAHLPSGAYLLTMESRNKVAHRRLALVR